MLKILSRVFISVGALLIIVPAVLSFLMQKSYDFYLAIINSSYPLSELGSAPVQVFVLGVLVLMGVGMIVFGLILNFILKRK